MFLTLIALYLYCNRGGPIEPEARGWTRKRKDDLQKYTLDAADTVELLTEALQHGRYRDLEWCEQRPTGPRATH